MAAGKIQSNEVVQGCVHAPRAKSIGNSPEAEKGKGGAQGKAEEGQSGHGHADGGYFPGAQVPYEAAAEQAGYDGASRNYHGENARVGYGNLQVLIEYGPGGPEKGVGQAQADE